MKKSIVTLLSTGLLCTTMASYAMENASIWVTNLSPANLVLLCTLSKNTSFYQYPGTSHTFVFSPEHTQMDESIDIKNETGDTVGVHCTQQNLPENTFTYDATGDHEKVKTLGAFEYDSAYPGALLYQP